MFLGPSVYEGQVSATGPLIVFFRHLRNGGVLFGPQHIIDAKDRQGRFGCTGQHLPSDAKRLNDAVFDHAGWSLALHVQTDVMGVLPLVRALPCHRLKQGIQWIKTGVLGEGARNDFKGVSVGFNCQLLPTREAFCEPSQVAGEGDLCRTTAGKEVRFLKQLAGHAEGVSKASLDFANRFVG